MSYKARCNLLLIMISIAYGLLFAILVLGYFFPGTPEPHELPWYVWAAIGEVLAMGVATVTVCVIVRKKDQQVKEKERIE